MSKTLEYNQHLISTQLLTLGQFSPELLTLEVSETLVSLECLFPDLLDDNSQKSTPCAVVSRVIQLVQKIDNGCADKLMPIHLSEVYGLRLGLITHKLRVQIRDLPFPILVCSLLNLQAHFVKLKYDPSVLCERLAAIYGDETFHIESRLHCKKLRAAGGINILAEVRSVAERLNAIAETATRFVGTLGSRPEVNRTPTKQRQEPDRPRKAHSKMHDARPGEKTACVWDKARFKYHFNCDLDLKKASIKALTGVTPYQQDHLDLSFEYLQARMNEKSYSLLIKDLRLKRVVDRDDVAQKTYLEANTDYFTILKVPELEALVIPEWGASDDYLFFIDDKDALRPSKLSVSLLSGLWGADSELNTKPRITTNEKRPSLQDRAFLAEALNLEVKLNIPRVENAHRRTKHMPTSMEDAMEKSDVPIFHIEADLLDELMKLPQMRREYLLLHGIKPAVEQESSLPEQEEPVGVDDLDSLGFLKHSNYVELLKNKINEQLNKEEENIAQFVSQVDFCSNTTSLRVIFTNSRLKAEVPHATTRVVGLQSLIESTTYSAKFVAVDLETKMQKAVTKVKKPQLVWEATGAKSDVRLLVVAYLHEDYRLLKFDHQAFEAYKRLTYESSMDNQMEFSRFFNLSPERTVRIMKSPLKQFTFRGSSSLIPIRSSLFEEPDEVPTPAGFGGASGITEDRFESFEQEMQRLLSAGLVAELSDSNEVPMSFLRLKSQLSIGAANIDDFSRIFNFQELSVFLSVMLIKYEQNKHHHLKFDHKDPSKSLDEHAVFRNFVTLMGSKILLTSGVLGIITEALKPSSAPAKPSAASPADAKPPAPLDPSQKVSADEELGLGGIRRLDSLLKPPIGGPNPNISTQLPPQNQNQVPETGISKIPGELSDNDLVSPQRLVSLSKRYALGLSLDKPQFCFFDSAANSQTLFTSDGACLVSVEQDLMEYDALAIDPRTTVRVVFQQLDLHAVDHHEESPCWLMAGRPVGFFTRILTATDASFVKRFFRLEEAPCDFSYRQTGGLRANRNTQQAKGTCKGWAGGKRNDQFLIDIKTFESAMDSKHYQHFLRLVAFVVETFVSSPKSSAAASRRGKDVVEDSKTKHMMNELHQLGKEGLMNHFEQQLRLTETQILRTNAASSLFEVNLVNVKLQLLKDGSPRYEFLVQDYLQSSDFEKSGRTEVRYQTRNLEILNYEPTNTEKKPLLRRLSQQGSAQDMMSIHQVHYSVRGKVYEHCWDVYRNFEIFLAPMILKLTPELYSFMMEFFFSKDTAKEPPRLVDEGQHTTLQAMVAICDLVPRKP